MLDQQNKLLMMECHPTDGLAATIHAKGMSARIGTHTNPSMPLLDRHVRKLDDFLDDRFRQTMESVERREIATAGLFNLTLWLGWLRTSEATGIRWCDMTIVEPYENELHDLPPHVGAVGFHLNPEIKSS